MYSLSLSLHGDISFVRPGDDAAAEYLLRASKCIAISCICFQRPYVLCFLDITICMKIGELLTHSLWHSNVLSFPSSFFSAYHLGIMTVETMELPEARPYAYRFRAESTALVIVDMQRDFLDPNGYGAIECDDEEVFRSVRNIVPRTQHVLAACRELGLHIFHTREGHKPDLSDLPPAKRLRPMSAPSGHHTIGIGDQGPMGRLLIRGEWGHDIIDELKPLPGEVVVDKPGTGSFWDTTLHRALLARGITHLLVAGVTTECCVNTTFREAADRGFECCVLSDCTSGFNASFVTTALDMLCSYDGLFGYVCNSDALLKSASPQAVTPPTSPPVMPHGLVEDLSISTLRKMYLTSNVRPTDVVRDVCERVTKYRKRDPAVWTHLESSEALLKAAQALEQQYHDNSYPPLYGIPFAVKDNIDVAGIRTTAASEEYAYMPMRSSRVVDAMLKAGALFIGKTNLDQLATGLSGTRSPFGVPRSVYDATRISGGSSSGSAIAVGAGLVSFALGTDTAGSGRVPAAFNGVTGFKPTKGTFSAQGLVPACKSLDTITVLAQTVQEARQVWLVGDEGPDLDDPYAKPQQSLPLWHVDFRGLKNGGFTFGVPPQSALECCTPMFKTMYLNASVRLQRAGGTPKEIDWTPFAGGNDLLYNGALLNERVCCLGHGFLVQHMDRLQPAIRDLFQAALTKDVRPWDVYRDQHLQAQYTREAAQIFKTIDVLLVPTVPCHPTVEEMEAEPLTLNAKLGEFTHFANVLDLCGIAVPAGEYESDAGLKLPFGVTLIGASGTDGKVFDVARDFERTA